MDPIRALLFFLFAVILCAAQIHSQPESDYYGLDEVRDIRSSYPQIVRHRLQLSLLRRPELMLRKRVSEQEINSLLRNTWLG